MPWQPSPLLPPDVEIVLTAYLRSALAGRPESYAHDVWVSNRVPKPRRDHMVIVRRDGGGMSEVRDVARVSFRVWAPSEKAATDLARLVQALLLAAADGDPIVRVAPQSGPTPIPDEAGAFLRYLVMDVHTRAATLT